MKWCLVKLFFFIVLNCQRFLLNHFLPCCCTSRTEHIDFSDVKVLEYCCYSSSKIAPFFVTMENHFFFFLVSAYLFIPSFCLFLFKANFKYIYLIMEIECQRMDKILETHSYLGFKRCFFPLQNAAFLYGLGLVYFHYNAFQW